MPLYNHFRSSASFRGRFAPEMLVPQISNGQRRGVTFSGMPRTMAAFEACMAILAFPRAQSSNCPDHEA